MLRVGGRFARADTRPGLERECPPREPLNLASGRRGTCGVSVMGHGCEQAGFWPDKAARRRSALRNSERRLATPQGMCPGRGHSRHSLRISRLACEFSGAR
jgi:hypothetical protein